MARKERKLDQFLSVIVLILYAVVIAVKWIMIYQDVSNGVINAISIISTVIQCLMICVVLYNALGWTDSIVMKIIFIVIALFLVVSSVLVWVPEIRNVFIAWQLPII